MKEYVFERFSDDWRRLINQAGVKRNMVKKEGNEYLNAVWDGMVAPDGKFYYPLSSESGMCGTTKLAWYDFEKDEVIVIEDSVHGIEAAVNAGLYTIAKKEYFFNLDQSYANIQVDKHTEVIDIIERLNG